MTDFLAYRIPNKESVKKNGVFTKATAPYKDGFYVSNHNKTRIYQFQEVDSEKEVDFFFAERTPYVASKAEYLIGAKSLLDAFTTLNLKKAVYGRVKSVGFDSKKCLELFDALTEEYPNAFVYLISSKQFGTWIGATPEILLSMHGQQGYTMSLAGTKKANVFAGDWIEKEFEEQSLVTEYIKSQLLSQNLKEIEQHGPFEMEAGPVRHLRTDFSFSSPEKNAMDIALKLHPTPAVAGVPTDSALDTIATTEHFHRDLYTGFLGILGEKHSYLYVNLRCCQIQDGKAFLYLGGGYTSKSIPEEEWEETENKAQTLLKVIEKVALR